MDYYKILEIQKTATDDEIKRAYRRLALQHHPDKNKNADSETFKQIQEAYETLSDPQKRQAYDGGGSVNPFDFHFNSFFGPHSRITRCANFNHVINVGLKDIFFGTIKRIKVKRDVMCKLCLEKCSGCNGVGQVTLKFNMGPLVQMIQQPCVNCNTRGFNKHKHGCKECNDRGKIQQEKLIEIDIYRGVEQGKTYIFPEWGQQPTKGNELPGDLIVALNIETDANFVRHGLNLIYTINLSLRESIVGKNVIIPLFNGDLQLHTKGFGIVDPNKTYTVFKRGLQSKDGKMGDLHLKFIVQYADKSFNDNELILLSATFDQVGLQ